jgi:hypothetical protein
VDGARAPLTRPTLVHRFRVSITLQPMQRGSCLTRLPALEDSTFSAPTPSWMASTWTAGLASPSIWSWLYLTTCALVG